MIKTPTYEVFSMFRNHQGAVLVDSVIDEWIDGTEGVEVPVLSESVSVTEQRQEGIKNITITLSNASLHEACRVAVQLPANQKFAGRAEISLLAEEVHAHNTFEEPEKVKQVFTEEEWSGNRQIITLPLCGVMRISCPVACEEFE